MTKYFLNSGGIKNSPDGGRKFFSEVLKGSGTSPKLLICAFAQPREDWEEKFSQDKDFFENRFSNEIKPVLELAFPETFEEQIKNSDVVYIHGGDDHLIQYWLRNFDLPKIWDGKVVMTSSAGSNALAKCFWTCDWRKCMDGLGIFPIKFLAHFKSRYGENDSRGPIDWDKAYAELKEYGDKDLPIYALEEGAWQYFEV